MAACVMRSSPRNGKSSSTRPVSRRAVRVGETVRLTGHTGTRPDGSFSADPAEQLRQTFANVADTLAAAGGTWADVEEITSFHVGLQGLGDLVLEVAGEFLSQPFPAWSAVGVTELYEPQAMVELRVVADDRSDATALAGTVIAANADVLVLPLNFVIEVNHDAAGIESDNITNSPICARVSKLERVPLVFGDQAQLPTHHHTRSSGYVRAPDRRIEPGTGVH